MDNLNNIIEEHIEQSMPKTAEEQAQEQRTKEEKQQVDAEYARAKAIWSQLNMTQRLVVLLDQGIETRDRQIPLFLGNSQDRLAAMMAAEKQVLLQIKTWIQDVTSK